jgi:hypothetical protein
MFLQRFFETLREPLCFPGRGSVVLRESDHSAAHLAIESAFCIDSCIMVCVCSDSESAHVGAQS